MPPQASPVLGAAHTHVPVRVSPSILSSRPWAQYRDLDLYPNSSSAEH